MSLRLFFDLDGTLFDVVGPVQYDVPDSVRAYTRPNPGACQRAAQLGALGHELRFLTGRTRAVGAVTLEQIAEAGLPSRGLWMQADWQGFPAMRSFKALVLRKHRADLFIGDHDADREAAALAEVPFVHADDFRAGRLFVRRGAP